MNGSNGNSSKSANAPIQSSFILANNAAKPANNATQVVNTTTNAVKNFGNSAVQATNTAITKANSIINETKSAITDTYNSIKPAVFGPVQESIQGAFDSETSPYFTIPIMIGLGVLIIALILMVMFKDQISVALDIAWQKLKAVFDDTRHGLKHRFDSASKPPMEEKRDKKSALDGTLPSNPLSSTALNNMLPGKKEVFNIADNKYTYSDAEPLCKAFGAELATYDQVKEAWNNGADWCNYGWVKGTNPHHCSRLLSLGHTSLVPLQMLCRAVLHRCRYICYRRY
jgi:archaellum component FlaG (FlaF/FlaG flagellin family)